MHSMDAISYTAARENLASTMDKVSTREPHLRAARVGILHRMASLRPKEGDPHQPAPASLLLNRAGEFRSNRLGFSLLIQGHP